MNELLFDLWPWNISSGPMFLLCFAGIVVWSMLVAWWVSRRIIASRESGEAPGIDDPSAPPVEVPSSSSDQPYRTRFALKKRLTIGSLPEAHDAWPIAYLRGGTPALAETLASAAVAAGWVNDAGTNASVCLPIEKPSDPLLADLHEEMGGGTTSSFRVLRSASHEVAGRFADAMKATLRNAGLARSAMTRFLIGSAFIGAAAADVAVGYVRCSRAVLLHRPFLILLFLLVVVLPALAIKLAWKHASRPSARAQRYLAWLDSATSSWRSEVVAGERVRPDEVANAVAIAGAPSIMSAPMFIAVVPDVSAWSHTTYSSSSYSSSSSSCSGGSSSSCASTGGGSSCASAGGGSSCGGGGGGSSCGGGGGGSSCGG